MLLRLAVGIADALGGRFGVFAGVPVDVRLALAVADLCVGVGVRGVLDELRVLDELLDLTVVRELFFVLLNRRLRGRWRLRERVGARTLERLGVRPGAVRRRRGLRSCLLTPHRRRLLGVGLLLPRRRLVTRRCRRFGHCGCPVRRRHLDTAGLLRETAHALVVRRDAHEALEDLAEEIHLARVASDASHLLLDLDRLGALTDRVERAREERERVEVARVRLEADLELRERLHAVLRLASREIELGADPSLLGIGLVMEQALEHLQRVVAPANPRELRGGGLELVDGALDVLHARERFGEPQVRERIGRIELDDLPEDVDRFLIFLLPLQARRDLVEGGERVARETELLIELGELRRDVPVPLLELRDVLRDDLADLLVDGDRFEREALVRIELPYRLVSADRVGVEPLLCLQVTDLEQGPSIVRICIDQLPELCDRLVVLLLLDVLLGGLEHLVAINRHVDEGSSHGATDRVGRPGVAVCNPREWFGESRAHAGTSRVRDASGGS